MSSTEVTIVGNVVSSPEQRRAGTSSVVKFRLAATERRYDTASGGWVDSSTFYVDVDCWQELGGNVIRSITKGDPVIVKGTLSTDEWESEAGRRQATKLRAAAVGPNLSRGHCTFTKVSRSAQPEGAGTPESDGPPAESHEGEELVAGRDYTGANGALYETNTADLAREPAHA